MAIGPTVLSVLRYDIRMDYQNCRKYIWMLNFCHNASMNEWSNLMLMSVHMTVVPGTLMNPRPGTDFCFWKHRSYQKIGCKNKGDFCENNEEGEFHQPQTYIRKWSKYMSYGRLQETRPGLETPCFMPILVRVDNVDQEDLTGLLFLNFFSHTSLRKLETCHENSWHIMIKYKVFFTQNPQIWSNVTKDLHISRNVTMFFEKHQKCFQKHGDL